MSRSRFNPSGERQMQIMRERGISIPKHLLETEAKDEAVAMAREHVAKVQKSMSAPAVVEEPPCPCKADSLVQGRHKLEDGSWCIDGVRWEPHELHKMRVLKFNTKNEQNYQKAVDAVTTLKRQIGVFVDEIYVISDVG